MKDLFDKEIKIASLKSHFIVPPFSVLNAREGYWQNRKRAWKDIGIKGEIGREQNILKISNKIINRRPNTASTSLFDPFLCELIYTWFCPKNGQIIDPFAGGSVRGIVASILGYKYWGCDLSHEQIDANLKQANSICENNKPIWVIGDSIEMMPKSPKADFILSCPPYGNLEKYSDHPRDLSVMDYHAFIAAYNRIIMKTVEKLKMNRFACFVVGDFRDKKGFYRNFISETISAFKTQKLELYNNAILVKQTVTQYLFAQRPFEHSRKLANMHENILVFIKGDPKKATEEITRRKNGQK